MHIRIDKELVKLLKEEAELQERSHSRIANKALRNYFANIGQSVAPRNKTRKAK